MPYDPDSQGRELFDRHYETVEELVGYLPGSVLITNNQGSPSSMSVVINPDAELASSPVPAVEGPARFMLVLGLLGLGSLGLMTQRRRMSCTQPSTSPAASRSRAKPSLASACEGFSPSTRS